MSITIPAHILPFWQSFAATRNDDVSARFYEAFHFADFERDADELANLVLWGVKRATAALLWAFEAEGKPPPEPGALSVVTNWRGDPLCVIETNVVNIVPYDQVTERFAVAEGEGDRSLRYWREVHWAYFGRECARIGREPSLQMPVICEEFTRVYSPLK